MSQRWTDPDLADGPEKRGKRRRSPFGVRPAFAGVATPLMLGLIAASAYLHHEPGDEAPSRRPRTTRRVAGRPVPLPPRPWPLAPATPLSRSAAGIEPRFVIQARPGIDEAMIRTARSGIDERIIVPASPATGPTMFVPYNPVPEPAAAEQPAIDAVPAE